MGAVLRAMRIQSRWNLADLKLGKDNRNTPDIALLQRKKTHVVFIYDAMQERQSDFARLGCGARCLSPAVSGEQLSMFKKQTGLLTTVIPLRQGFTNAPRLPVHGELILIKTQRLIELDTHHENGVQFRRERVRIELPFYADHWDYGHAGLFVEKKWKTASVDAWMYVGVQEYWAPFLDGGYTFKPCVQHRPNKDYLKPYYAFNCTEYPNCQPSPMP